MKTVLVIVSLLTHKTSVVYVPEYEGQTIPVRLACHETMLRVPAAIALRADGYPDLPALGAYAKEHVHETPVCPYGL